MSDWGRLLAPSVFQVANYLIQKGVKKKAPLNHLQIQKLCYIAHGYLLGYFDVPLFYEQVVAWPYGPVIEELFSVLKSQRMHPISGRIKGYTGELDGMHMAICDYIFDMFAPMGNRYLSAFCARKGGAWDKTRNGRQASLVISDELIKREFKRCLKTG